jgi:uncharacterized protein (TIGR00369 family)
LTEFSSPYAATLGLRRDGARVAMPFADGLMGRPGFLHGGAISGLLENTAWVAVLDALPDDARIKPVTVTVDFLRGGAMIETYAEAEIVRLGRRIANVLVTAWQDDRAKPIATANLKLMIERAG